MARSNSNQSNGTTPAATASPQDNAQIKDTQSADPVVSGSTADKVTDENQDLNEQQKAGTAQTQPQPDDPEVTPATGAQSQAQKANEAIRPESALHNLKSKQLTRVKFTHPWQRYAPGDRAGFDPKTAAELVKRGIAESL
ncbi:hypothetical protein [Salinicola rhizosphaerae]|uniref:Uncharacterized protein n=1 Tax=Salinicola rhizosphaerae TaxID=1443141 RepID=A0ABQ3E8Y5_9GAMM|nr:hypothetical protein [Salinicola rhizosphaerae]GHB30506.1 hypothetical protein GCM10009038_31620 [Salinicola rhizosphaerae]